MELAAIALAGFATTGAAIGLAWYLARRRDAATIRAFAALESQARLVKQVATLESAVSARDDLIDDLETERDAESSRAAAAEEHRDELLHSLSELGDPRAVAARIRAELSALSELSTAGATAPTEDREGAGAVRDGVGPEGS